MKSSPTAAPKTAKGTAPKTHTHRCPAGGGHDWQHPDPCGPASFRTKLCPEHPLVKDANGAPAIGEEPQAQSLYTVQPIGKMFYLIAPDGKPVKGPVFKTAMDAQAEADRLAHGSPEAPVVTHQLVKTNKGRLTIEAQVQTPKAQRLQVVAEKVAELASAPVAAPAPAIEPPQANAAQLNAARADEASQRPARQANFIPAPGYVLPVLPLPPRCLVPACPRDKDIRGLCAKCYSVAKSVIDKGLTTWATLEAAGKSDPVFKAMPGAVTDLPHARAWFLGAWAPVNGTPAPAATTAAKTAGKGKK